VRLPLQLFLLDGHFADHPIEFFLIVEDYFLKQERAVGLLLLQVGDVAVGKLSHHVEATVQLLQLLAVFARRWSHSI